MEIEKTRETQYQRCLELRDTVGLNRLGLAINQTWQDDPRRLGIVLARYKFVAKMLRGCRRVLEVGCADAFPTRVVRQEVEHITAVDFDPILIQDARECMKKPWTIEFKVHDILESPVPGKFNGAFTLDTLEHISKPQETKFVENIARSLEKDGTLIVGTPSGQSQVHASKSSKSGHVNCKTDQELVALLSEFFHQVFLFSMNDEVVHTGFYPLAHYFIAICCISRLT